MLKHVVGIVSGGASGLGAAAASLLVRHGARVVVADLPHQRDAFLRMAAIACADAAQTSSHDDSSVLAFAETDVTDEEQVKRALDRAEEYFGSAGQLITQTDFGDIPAFLTSHYSVNVAINCAGIATAKKTLSKSRSEEGVLNPHALDDFSRTLQINTVGSFNVGRLAAERMTEHNPDNDGLRGCIINTASIAAYDGQIGQAAYAASKGAIVGMTLPMARDLAPYGIRVMTIAPGLFQTPLVDGLPDPVKDELGKMVPLPSRLGKPDEFGALVVSILSNPMLNGEVIRLDGALRMPPK